MLRWLNANKVDFVVVGPVAHAIRGELTARGPVAIVPAPYNRNFERLTNALIAQNAGLRSDRALAGPSGSAPAVPVKLDPDKLARGRRWLLRFSGYDLDVEGTAPRYQELLYEAGRFELAPEVSVEVASPEDLEHFSHVRRTGVAPEFRVIRKPTAADGTPDQTPGDHQQSSAPRSDSPADS